jgi:hypothetical protein
MIETPVPLYDLAVALRVYPSVSKPAQKLPFGNDKLLLVETCLRSFKQSLGSLRVKIWAILDSCPEEYEALFRRFFAPADLVVIKLNAAGNAATFGKQIDILLTQTDAELVYFAEDDYFYLPGKFPLLVDFLSSGEGIDFISPYDHLDCYTLDLHHRPKWIRIFGSHHWRTASSTCLTFLTRKKTLKKYQREFRSYTRGNFDSALWLSITKDRVFNPFLLARYVARNQFYWKILVKAWLYGWAQILFGRRGHLWIPIPAIGTHLDSNSLSPTVEWVKLMFPQIEAKV